MLYLLNLLHSNSEDRVPEEEVDVTLQFRICNILEYILQLVFEMYGFDVLKALRKLCWLKNFDFCPLLCRLDFAT